MIHRTIEDDRTYPFSLTISYRHLKLIDRTYLGQDVFKITDKTILADCVRKGQYLDTIQTQSVNHDLKDLHAACWIQLNRLSDNLLLKFKDVIG